jgi:hypothetical protein
MMLTLHSRKGLLFVFLTLLAATADAGVNRWTAIGPQGAWFGRAVADPSSKLVYVPTFAGDVYRSEDGLHWDAINDGLPESVTFLAFTGGNPSTLFAATRKGSIARYTGSTWEIIGAFSPSVSIASDVDAGILYALDLGSLHRYSVTSGEWRRLNPPVRVTSVVAAAGVVVIQTSGPGPRQFVGRDDIWSAVTNDFVSRTATPPPLVSDRSGKRFLSVNENRLMELPAGSTEWKNAALPPLPVNCCVSDIAVDRGTVVVNTPAVPYIYDAEFAAWRGLGFLPGRAPYLLITPDLYYAWSGSSLYVAGKYENWRSITNSFAVPYIYDLVVDDEEVFATTGEGMYGLRSGGPFTRVAGNQLGVLALDTTSHTLFSSTSDGIVWTRDGGRLWTTAWYPTYFDDGVYAIAVIPSKLDPTVYVTMASGLWKMDGAENWQSLNPPVPGSLYSSRLEADAADGSLYIATEDYFFHREASGKWTSLGPIDSPAFEIDNSGRVFAFRNGEAVRSSDHGLTWQRGGRVDGGVNAVAVDEAHPDVLYAGTADGRIYRTTNAGETWNQIGDTLPAGRLVTRLRLDNEGKEIYAATAGGVFHYAIDESYLAAARTYSVSIQSNSGNFVRVETDDRVTANGTTAYGFALYDVNGGDLRDGDVVHLRTARGDFVAAEGGGANDCAGCEAPLYANRLTAGVWESFVIHRASGAGIVGSGDAVTFTSSAGNFIAAENGGFNSYESDSPLHANRSAAYAWETFRLTIH